MRRLNDALTKLPANRIIAPLRILLTIGIGYTLANTAIYFVSDAPRSPLPAAAHVQVEKHSNTIAEIAAAELFGRVASTAAAAPDADAPAPDSNLDLTLEGVFLAKDPDQSTAIVAERNKPGQLFAIGAAVSGNVMLARVSDDHIVLRRSASFETLRFPQLTGSAALSDDSSALAAPAEMIESAGSPDEAPTHDYHDDLPPPPPSSGESSDADVGDSG